MAVRRALTEFLSRELPGLRLRPGGYQSYPSLRFELGGEIRVEAAAERSAQAASRAALIYEHAIAPEDEGFVVFTRWSGAGDELFPSLLPDAARIERDEGQDFYEQGEDTPHTTITTAVRPREFDYHRCFSWIANAELARSPSLDGRVYVVDRSRPLVFHMYDDRGAIALAPDPARLVSLRTAFDDWLVRDDLG